MKNPPGGVAQYRQGSSRKTPETDQQQQGPRRDLLSVVENKTKNPAFAFTTQQPGQALPGGQLGKKG